MGKVKVLFLLWFYSTSCKGAPANSVELEPCIRTTEQSSLLGHLLQIITYLANNNRNPDSDRREEFLDLLQQFKCWSEKEFQNEPDTITDPSTEVKLRTPRDTIFEDINSESFEEKESDEYRIKFSTPFAFPSIFSPLSEVAFSSESSEEEDSIFSTANPLLRFVHSDESYDSGSDSESSESDSAGDDDEEEEGCCTEITKIASKILGFTTASSSSSEETAEFESDEDEGLRTSHGWFTTAFPLGMHRFWKKLYSHLGTTTSASISTEEDDSSESEESKENRSSSEEDVIREIAALPIAIPVPVGSCDRRKPCCSNQRKIVSVTADQLVNGGSSSTLPTSPNCNNEEELSDERFVMDSFPLPILRLSRHKDLLKIRNGAHLWKGIQNMMQNKNNRLALNY